MSPEQAALEVRRRGPSPVPPVPLASPAVSSGVVIAPLALVRRRCRNGEPTIGRLDGVERVTALRDVIEQIPENLTPVELVEPLVRVPPLPRLGIGSRLRPWGHEIVETSLDDVLSDTSPLEMSADGVHSHTMTWIEGAA